MSKKFTFRLQKVLNYRENKETQAQNELAQAINSLKASLGELEALKTELMEVHQMRKTSSGPCLDIQGTLNCTRYADMLAGRISSKKKTVLEKENAVNQNRLQLKDKMVERKVLSSLKEKRHLVFKKEKGLTEQKMNDEFAVTAHFRQQ